MSITSRLVNRWMHLPPAKTYDIVVTRDIQIPMPDGVILLADHYASRYGIRQPTILIRSPYGRRGFLVHFQLAPTSSAAFRCLSRVAVAQQAPQVNSGLHAMNTMTGWQPLSGSSVRIGSRANSPWSAQATSALCSGP